MKRAIVILTASLAAVLIPTPSVLAQITGVNECYQRVASELIAVHDEYRSHLFGSRTDRDGTIQVLTGGRTDERRKGIFETKGRLTSELVGPLVESYRVMRCRATSVCQVLADSFQKPGGTTDIQPLGCAKRSYERYGECYFAGTLENGESKNNSAQIDVTTMTSQCSLLVGEMLESERAVLRLSVAYDAGYRSLLQLAGMMDWMLEGFPEGTIKAVGDMVNLLGKLHQIPCFIGQCDNPDTDSLTP